MSIRVIAAAGTGIALALVLGGGTAHADPPGATPNDPNNGRIFCNAIAANPTPAGVRAAMRGLMAQVNVDDTIDGMAYGLMYVCPEYHELFANTYDLLGWGPGGAS